MTKIAINGLGRIGKLVLKSLIEHGVQGEIVLLNDAQGSVQDHATWLEFDTVHGRWPAEITHDADHIMVNGHRMRMTHAAKLADLQVTALDVDLLIDCTGFFKVPNRVQPYFDAGAKKVIVSAPITQAPAFNLVYGVNHDQYDPEDHHLLTGTSSTTNCLAPIVKVIHEELEIVHGSITTLHGATNTQTLVDRPAKDARRARSALNSLVPTTTNATTTIPLIFPELEGRLNGHAVRVPVLNASLIDCVFEVAHETTQEEVNELFLEYSEGPLRGIIGYENRPLISADYLNDPRSCIIDAQSTMVVNNTQVKIYAWHDNEWSYACRLADITRMVANLM